MGGDYAPYEVLKGAVDAKRRGCEVLLVGPKNILAAELEVAGAVLPVVDAPAVIAMDEPVSQALRRKDSGLHVACGLVSSGDASAVVSCGNSAAIMAVALHTWGLHAGIDRPAFGSMLPTQAGGVFILDIGANPTVKASNLVQFAVMGDVFIHLSRGIESPRIALLSNGSEDSKGTREVKEANKALRKADLNFVGNIEGNHVFVGDVDVVVCDGFSGNVLLKGAEGVASEIFELMRAEVTRDLFSKVAAAGLRPAFDRIKRRLDFEEYGGAPVLGVNEIMINCHGRSRAKAVTNAILLAHQLSQERLVERIGQALQHGEMEVSGRTRRLVRALHLRHADT
jgi:glycerol-3-phosphate acyltransferase PlsX